MPKKILLADDSITIQKVVELTFSEGDYQVFSVGNGAQALKKIHEVRPDVALLDVIMPEANGYEVCEKVKRNPETSWIPVLLLTGTFEPFDRKRADAAGANGHLTKPFESQMLVSKVEELIASSHHPVIQPDQLERMEIVAGGTTRLEGESPSFGEARPDARPSEEAELTRQSIVPDRFDDSEEQAASREPQGIPAVPMTSDGAFPSPPSFPREEIPPTPAPETAPGTWDELASDLGSARSQEPYRDPGSPGYVTPAGQEPLEPPRRETSTAPWSTPPPREPEPISPDPSMSADSPFSGTLSEADVERVAARVVAQMSEKVIREIAWEVIPELAENLIRRRIQDLEEKISREN
jgi:CheY-like chemotaxis protein